MVTNKNSIVFSGTGERWVLAGKGCKEYWGERSILIWVVSTSVYISVIYTVNIL